MGGTAVFTCSDVDQLYGWYCSSRLGLFCGRCGPPEVEMDSGAAGGGAWYLRPEVGVPIIDCMMRAICGCGGGGGGGGGGVEGGCCNGGTSCRIAWCRVLTMWLSHNPVDGSNVVAVVL